MPNPTLDAQASNPKHEIYPGDQAAVSTGGFAGVTGASFGTPARADGAE